MSTIPYVIEHFPADRGGHGTVPDRKANYKDFQNHT